MTMLFIVLLICVHASMGQDPKYCDKSLCTRWDGTVLPHIACPGNAPSQCPSDAQEIIMTDEIKNFIMTKHNTYRDNLAGGQITHLPTASQMPVMQWDNELANIARANVMRCVYGHDKCRNTATLKWVGQNIAWTGGYPSDMAHVTYAVEGWWNEYKDCQTVDINKYKTTPKVIGHFTAMSQDRSNKVGCAAVKYNKNNRIMACNYAFTNLSGSFVYRTGAPTSGCKTGRHSVYKNLCSEKEVVNSNP